MIYRNDVLINWKNPQTLDDELVSTEIIDVKNRYFSDNTHRIVKVLYPRGEPKAADIGMYQQLKIFPIPLWSTDGEWRWSKSKRTNKTKTNPSGFVDHHRNIRHQDVFTEKDLEFLWFLSNRCSALNKKVFIEDLEEKAKTKVQEMATDADIKYMLMGKSSPVAKDEKLIRQVADIFGLRDTSKMQINEVKLALYDAILEGEKMGDKFVNFVKFEQITEGNVMRKAAYLARTAINDGMVGYKDHAWWIMSGRSYEEKLLGIKATEAAFRDQVLIDEVVNNANIRDRLFSVMGETNEITIDDLRDLDRPALQRKFKDLTGEFINSKKEEIIEKICAELKIGYVAPT